MSATLVVETAGGGWTQPCGAMVTIGRIKPNDIVLGDPKVSRNHALVRVMGDGRYYLIDTGSSNGTYVNGQRVIVPWALNDGDRIEVGGHVLCFANPVAPGAAAADSAEGNLSTLVTVGGILRIVTILVTDIRGYTALSRSVEPDVLAAVLGTLFRDITRIVERHGGAIDKFIGDAVMARWLADRKNVGASVLAALRTARDIADLLETMQARASELPVPIRMGVGINSGQALLGNIGAHGLRDYTAVGDTVNVAFRLEAASKELGTDVVLGPDAYVHLPENTWQGRLLSATLKGIPEPVQVCALGFADLAAVVPPDAQEAEEATRTAQVRLPPA